MYNTPKTIIAKDNKDLKDLVKSTIKKQGFNCDLNHIDISKVVNLAGVFSGSCFNGDISEWDVSHVTSMYGLFFESSFDGDISSWNTSSVVNMQIMFSQAQFNGDLSRWNTSNVKTMHSMFEYSIFNGDISKWNVSNVDIMTEMFFNSEFNRDLSGWDVSNVKKMDRIFQNAMYNQELSGWLLNSLLESVDAVDIKTLAKLKNATLFHWFALLEKPNKCLIFNPDLRAHFEKFYTAANALELSKMQTAVMLQHSFDAKFQTAQSIELDLPEIF